MSVHPEPSASPPRRVVLIDFDWQDADLLPELVRRPELSVRLVAGQNPGDPGLRIAELCGLPRTVDLGDLTREIFDLALVSERSARRTQIEGLLHVLGTPCVTPESFLEGAAVELAPPAVEASPLLHAAALETSLGGSYDEMLSRAIPDGSAPVDGDHPPSPRPAPAEAAESSFETFPTLEDRRGLEAALSQLLATTGATVAEVHTGRNDDLERIAHVGSDDPLLNGLVELALRMDAPQVVSRLTGPESGRAWGAWPFHTASHHGVVAAGGIHPVDGWTAWEQMVEELRTKWDERDRAQAAPAFPMVPEHPAGWLDPREFRVRIELATERHRRDGLRFAVHQLAFAEDVDVFERAGGRLPDLLRDTDFICRSGETTLLLLTPHAPRAWDVVRERVLASYRETWQELGRPGEAPDPAEQHLELLDANGIQPFLDGTAAWLPV
jgi:hypothetical protein